ncbi:cytochrome c-type biogenesis protein CcmH [Jiella sp. M17.18]|uniref:cytochrome c-type biogenesis protein n=1 Tax=Jiella sp. M17.18 TaxID=3234247 RepID=UPI0034DE28BA
MVGKLAIVFAAFALLVAAVPAGLLVAPAYAVNPDEMLKDPVLEARARHLSEGLRCLVCQNESIDASNADLAKDLRLLVRKRIKAGDTDQEVIDYLVSRYGEFVLLKPRFDWRNLALWATPVVALLAGLAFALRSAATRRRRQGPAPLTAQEEAAIADVVEAQR